MKEKFINHFKRWRSKTFLWLSVLILLLLDLGNGQFLRLSWFKNNSSFNLANLLASRGEVQLSELSQDTLIELIGMIDNTFLFFLFIILLNNIFFYFFTLRGKLWAHSFLVFYTMTGALFSLIMVKDSFSLGITWGVFNVLSIVVYGYIFFGLKFVKFPPHETKTSAQ